MNLRPCPAAGHLHTATMKSVLKGKWDSNDLYKFILIQGSLIEALTEGVVGDIYNNITTEAYGSDMEITRDQFNTEVTMERQLSQ